MQNVREEVLTFKDGATYRGQAFGDGGAAEPHGYGQMETKEGFIMTGYFKNGKSYGPGIFRAPNGDRFYGTWNDEHKRSGRGLSVQAATARQTVESYDNGKQTTKVVRRAPPKTVCQWLGPAGWPADFKGNPPRGRSGHSATVLADASMLLIFGGQTLVEGRLVALNDVHLLDIDSGNWMQPEMKGTPPPAMAGHTAVAVGHHLYIIGGQNGMEVSSAVYVLDVTSGTWSCPIVKGINFAGHTASLVGHTIWVIVESSIFSLDTRQLKTGHMAWKQEDVDIRGLKRTPRSCVAHAAVAVGPMIVVFGGKVIGGVHNGAGKKYERCTSDVRIFHTDRLAWEVPDIRFEDDIDAKTEQKKEDYSGVLTGTWQTPRAELSATLVGNKIYCFGGWASRNPEMNQVDVSYLNDVTILDMERMVWTAPSMRTIFTVPRGAHTATLVKDAIWVFGGHNFATEALDDFNILTTGEDERAYLRRQAAAPKKPPSGGASAAAPATAAPLAATVVAPTKPPPSAATPAVSSAPTTAAVPSSAAPAKAVVVVSTPAAPPTTTAPSSSAATTSASAPSSSAATGAPVKRVRKTWDRPAQ